MRTIKFRGKKPTNGVWVYGSLVYSNEIDAAIYFQTGSGSVKSMEWVYVNPDTVCQFTGFLDKNGKEIYEGDILRSDEYPVSNMEDDARDNYFGIIEWSNEEAMFLLTCVKNPTASVRGISDGISDEITQQKLEDCEIVGNIHDQEWHKKLNLKDE